MFKRKKLVIILIILVILGISVASFLNRVYVVPVLMYHSVIPNPDKNNRLTISVESFQRQMYFLKQHKYNVINLEEFVKLVKANKKIPPKTVIITFDDGYDDNYIYAYPILLKYNLPADIFIIFNEMDTRRRMSWDNINTMVKTGLITIGSHCLGPEPLTNLESEQELRNEIFGSKKALEAKLGMPVKFFSYPEGRFNKKIRQLVIDAGYDAAVATNPGKKYPNNDPYVLKRVRISSTADNLFIFWVQASGYYNFMRDWKEGHGKRKKAHINF